MNHMLGLNFSFTFTNWLTGAASGSASPAFLFAEFLAGCVIVFFAGRSLTKSADAIGEKFNWGHAWVGLLMLATITSMPELVTNIGSISLAGAPDLAFGNIMGSCAFNIFILFLLTLFYMRTRNAEGKACFRSVLAEGSSRQRGPLMWGVTLIAVAIAGMVFFSYGPRQGWLPAGQENLFDWIFAVGLITPLYLIAMFVLFKKEKAAAVEESPAEASADAKNPFVPFAISAVFIIGAGIWLSLVGSEISQIKVGGAPIGGSIVGALLLGVATSLPELVVTFAALKMGSVNLALGNVFGSNMFNIWVFSYSKLFHPDKPLFDRFAQDDSGGQLYSHLGIAALAVVLSILAILGLGRKAAARKHAFPWVGVLIGVVYLAGFAALFYLRGVWGA